MSIEDGKWRVIRIRHMKDFDIFLERYPHSGMAKETVKAVKDAIEGKRVGYPRPMIVGLRIEGTRDDLTFAGWSDIEWYCNEEKDYYTIIDLNLFMTLDYDIPEHGMIFPGKIGGRRQCHTPREKQ